MIVGHAAAQKVLVQELPSACLLIGPPSIGKRTMVNHYLRHHGILVPDTTKPVLNPDTARELHRFFATAPFGKRKVAVLNLDRASPASVNVLLKLLEEPPPSASFLMIASISPLLTIQSRSTLLRCNYLNDDEVYHVLVARFAMPPEEAQQAARMSGGQISRALESSDLMTSKSPVLSLLKASAEGNEPLFYSALVKWGANEHQLLKAWSVEARTGRWQIFSSEESFGLAAKRNIIERVNKALRTGARPRIAAKLALIDVMEANR